ncbi:MAG: hypothetical protein IT169_09810 [Bryobacterales bacterium]|nr:hypothetical protein [Bryobacterales bacterium]
MAVPAIPPLRTRGGLLVLALLLGGFTGSGFTQFRPILDHAKSHCVSFQFPRWDIRNMWDYGGLVELEFRTTGDTDTAFLVGLRSDTYQYEAGKRLFWYSDQKYLISMKTPGEVQSVPDDIWEEAEIVNPYRYLATSEAFRFAHTLRNGEFDLASRTVKLRGKHWAGWILDHAVYNIPKRFVALQSMNGKLLFDGEVYGGRAFVQVFDVESGEELFWIEGKWNKRGSSVVFAQTKWIRDDLLAVTFDPALTRGTALCKVP